MKLHKSKKDPELYHYFTQKGKKRWMYRHKYYDGNGERQEKKKRFSTEKEAYHALLKIKVDTLKGAFKQAQFSNYTIAKWFDTWFETYSKDWEISTRTQRESAIRLHIKPLLGNYKLADLSKSIYKKEFINKLLESKKFSTVETFHKIFKIGINAAVEEEIIPKNRFTKIKVQNKTEKNFITNAQENYLEPHDLIRMLKTAKEIENITNYSLLYLLAHTGLRRGEANGLRWNDIDFENQKLTVDRTRDRKGKRPPKTINSYRTIDIDKSVIDQLSKYRTWCKETKLSFGKHLKNNDFIFISYQTGEPLSDNTINKAIDRVVEKGNIKRITPHGLRHTHATILLNDREMRLSTKDVADRLGDTVREIEETYHHVLPKRRRETATIFTDILSSTEVI
jgi:integrase